MGNLREEILMLIHRYENKVRGIDGSIAEAGAHGEDVGMLVSRKNAYTLDMIPDLKRLLELVPESKKAEIVKKFPDTNEEVLWGTYDYNTTLERLYVNELAMRIRHEQFCETEVRIAK